MTHIVHLPITYHVEGVLRGRRTTSIVPFVETLPFEVGEIERPWEVLEHRVIPFRIQEGRPWFPLVGERGERMTVDAANKAAAVFAAKRPTTPRLADDGSGVSPLLGRPWRHFAKSDRAIVLAAGERIRDAFSRVETSDRDDAVAVSRRVAERLRVMGGFLVTDRYEPLDDAGLGEERVRGALVHDLVTGRETIVKSYGGESLVYGARNWAEPGPAGLLPYGETWFERVAWETDPSAPVAHWMARNLRKYTVDVDAAAVALREALGFAAVSQIAGIVQWHADLEGGRPAPMTMQALDRIVDEGLRGLGAVDRMGMAVEIDRVETVFSTARTLLVRIAERTASPPTFAPEDASALRLSHGV